MTRSILLVEDDHVAAASLKEQLEDRDVTVTLAHSVAEARTAAVDCVRPCDLALIDYRLPDGYGTELGGRLLQSHGIPFALLTADTSAPVVQAAVAAGAVGFVLKPALAEGILPTIETAIARATEMKRLAGAVARLAANPEEKRGVHVATGMIMERFHLTDTDAGRLLRYFARSRRITLEAAAEQIIDASGSLDLLAAANRFVDKRSKAGGPAKPG
ncbi:MAG: response regulator [Gammaproteobacteria bacterium]|nr:response regulator [Gammaproteobacteria bacterium]